MTPSEFQSLRNDLNSIGGLKLILGGQSMAPAIKDRETVSFVPVDARRLRKFDIVAFYDRHSLVCHYVSEITNEHCVCKSLQFPGEDCVPFESLLGRVSSHRLTWWRKLFLALFG